MAERQERTGEIVCGFPRGGDGPWWCSRSARRMTVRRSVGGWAAAPGWAQFTPWGQVPAPPGDCDESYGRGCVVTAAPEVYLALHESHAQRLETPSTMVSGATTYRGS